MSLTRSTHDVTAERLRLEPEFRVQLLAEAAGNLMHGDVEVGMGQIRAVSDATGFVWMLNDDRDPPARELFKLIGSPAKYNRTKLVGQGQILSA
jgi:hypothetical protein